MFLAYANSLIKVENKAGCVTGKGPFGPMIQNSHRRGANEALLVRFFKMYKANKADIFAILFFKNIVLDVIFVAQILF